MCPIVKLIIIHDMTHLKIFLDIKCNLKKSNSIFIDIF